MQDKELQLEDTVSADRKERIIYVGPGKTRKISSITSRQNFNNEKFTRKANKGEDEEDEQEKVEESAIQNIGTSQIETGAPTQSDLINQDKKIKSNSPQIQFVTGTEKAGSSSTAIGNAQNMGIKKISEALVKKALTKVKADKNVGTEEVPFDGPYTKTPDVVVDKSGARHTAYSRVRSLARQAMNKQAVKEESALDKVRARTGFDAAASNRRREEKAEHEHSMKIARDEHNHAHNVAWDKESERARKERNDSHRQQSDKVTDAMISMTKKKIGEEVEHITEGGQTAGNESSVHDQIKNRPAMNTQQFKDKMNDAGNRTAGDPFKKKYKPTKPNNPIPGTVTKSTNEEVEQIDELSVGALKSYINKANPEVKAAKAERQSAREGGDLKTADSARRTADKRTAGIKQAKAKLNKEGTEMKTYQEFLDQLLEYTPGPGGITRVQGRSYGAQYHDPEGDDDADDKPAAKADTPKRGRGRPAGSKSGANQKVTTGKSYGGIATHSLHLPNSK